MRILVCGGRAFANKPKMWAVLSEIVKVGDIIIHGCAGRKITEIGDPRFGEWIGADMMADQWARENGIEVDRYPAEWSKYGNSAGPIRNGQMIKEGYPDLVVAFHGGHGTADMVAQARAAGIEVKVC